MRARLSPHAALLVMHDGIAAGRTDDDILAQEGDEPPPLRNVGHGPCPCVICKAARRRCAPTLGEGVASAVCPPDPLDIGDRVANQDDEHPLTGVVIATPLGQWKPDGWVWVWWSNGLVCVQYPPDLTLADHSDCMGDCPDRCTDCASALRQRPIRRHNAAGMSIPEGRADRVTRAPGDDRRHPVRHP
jgi:hypothetical protein